MFVTGKGGVGKSATSALLARALAERGLQVLAMDLDSNPGLALSLGVPLKDNPLPDEIIEEVPGAPYGWDLATAYDPDSVVDRCSVDLGNGIRFLSFGNIAQARNNLRRFVTASWKVAGSFEREGWALVGDLEAGPTSAFEGVARSASIVLILVEVTPASILAARRIASILEHDGTDHALVVLKSIDGSDEACIAQELRIPVAVIPWDYGIRRAEKSADLLRLGRASPAFDSVRRLARWLHEREKGEAE